MMKSIVADTILESRDKKFANHSARKTVERKLKKANVERSGIVKVTGHKNIQSVIKRLRRGKRRRTATAFVCHFREE